ncbi:MAG: hypothetical protein EBS54_05400, partial [Betaproteobacteria bacterium]|nr:hypothetical protein [Betaproteobacteria bacterium]
MFTTKFGNGTSGDFDELGSLAQGLEGFTADLIIEGQAYGCFYRSPHAHAHILNLDVSEARALDGVIDIITSREVMEADLGLIPPLAIFQSSDGRPMFQAGMPVLANDTVRYQGEPIALIIAKKDAIAQRATSLIRADFELMQAHTDPVCALKSDGIPIHSDCANNLVLDWIDGDQSCTDVVDGSPIVVAVELKDPPVAA